jgi:hypothetical protein
MPWRLNCVPPASASCSNQSTRRRELQQVALEIKRVVLGL